LIVYLTFNDHASGVFASQVTDVVQFLRNKNKNIRLVAFISLRNYVRERKAIRKLSANAIVLPMFPGVKNWKMNTILLRLVFLFLRPRVLMCRGIFAAHLGLKTKSPERKIVFDARGAYYAEFSEYNLVNDAVFTETIKALEKEAILKSDKCLVVSNALLNYWKEVYLLEVSSKSKVIPCTLSTKHVLTGHKVSKEEHNFSSTDIVLVYSGSVAGWQSFSFLFRFLSGLLASDERIKILFLAKNISFQGTALEPFSHRIVIKWLNPHEVKSHLEMADYGLLIREDSVTNKVSSPTKFAEYLAAGCNVLISDNIGDFPGFVRKYGCGKVVNAPLKELTPVDREQRLRNRELALEHFSKEAYLGAYQYLVD